MICFLRLRTLETGEGDWLARETPVGLGQVELPKLLVVDAARHSEEQEGHSFH